MSVQKTILTFFKPGGITPKRNPISDQNVGIKRFKTCLSESDSDVNESGKKPSIHHNENCNLISNGCDKIDDERNQNGSNLLTKGITDPPVIPEDVFIEKKRLLAKLKLVSKKFPIVDPEIGVTWIPALEKEFSKPYFQKLNDFVDNERRTKTIFPPREKVWTWTKLCQLDEIKVVIIGQDPYHNPGQAHGLSFSVPVGVPLPPSLQNMFKELKSNCGFEDPGHGYLMGWAKQGVLLLNAVLTVEAHKPNSHRDQGWEKVTTAVIKYLNDNYKGIVFLLWGSYAQKKADFVDKKKHHILKAVHPSPLSAHRGFFGCEHFIKCNELLVKQNVTPINWNWLPKGGDDKKKTL